MRPLQVGKVELDRCSFCNGLWFDGGELEQVLGKKLIGALVDSTPTSRRCAQCAVPMRSAELGGLQVEVCTTCKGVFLDDGELVRLNDGKQVRVQVQAQPQVAPAPRPEAKVKDDVMDWLATLGA